MKFAYFNPTVVAVDEVPTDVFRNIKEKTEEAHSHIEFNDEGNPGISIRGGQQIQIAPNEFGLDYSSIKEYIENACSEYILNITKTSGRTELDNFKPTLVSAWTIKQGPGDYQSLHNHEAHISGNIYIDVPDFSDDAKPSDGNVEFRLPVIRNPAHLIFTDQWRYQPEPASMIIFPSYLPHTVYPWKGTGERTVLAWDVQLLAKSQQTGE